MCILQQENEDLKKKMEGDERIKGNLRKRVGELERQRQVDQQGGSWRLEQENRTWQEEIDELNHKIRTIEEEKEHLKTEIEEKRKFYEDNMDYMYNSMLDQHRAVIQEKQELDGRNQALQREKQDFSHMLFLASYSHLCLSSTVRGLRSDVSCEINAVNKTL